MRFRTKFQMTPDNQEKCCFFFHALHVYSFCPSFHRHIAIHLVWRILTFLFGFHNSFLCACNSCSIFLSSCLATLLQKKRLKSRTRDSLRCCVGWLVGQTAHLWSVHQSILYSGVSICKRSSDQLIIIREYEDTNYKTLSIFIFFNFNYLLFFKRM